jgi:hypothetical protein
MKQYVLFLFLLVSSCLCTGQQLTRAEYFIGEDPGFSLAIPIPISSSEEDLSLDFTADIHTLSEGFHFISIRARDSLGRWGLPVQRIFYVFKTQTNADKQITGTEYFIDTDPGFGLATPVPVSSPGNILTLDFTANIESLSEGFHFLNIRARDDLGIWGLPAQRIFYVFKDKSTEESKITGIEYFIDTDPGFGNGTAVSLASSGNDQTVAFVVNVAALTDGEHILYVRSKDALNRWGQMYSQGFTSLYTSVGEIKVESFFKLYPNPSDGNFYLEFSNEQSGPIKLFIDDLNGKRVYGGEYYGRINLLNLNLQAGLYLLNVELEENSFTHKIIIH